MRRRPTTQGAPRRGYGGAACVATGPSPSCIPAARTTRGHAVDHVPRPPGWPRVTACDRRWPRPARPPRPRSAPVRWRLMPRPLQPMPVQTDREREVLRVVQLEVEDQEAHRAAHCSARLRRNGRRDISRCALLARGGVGRGGLVQRRRRPRTAPWTFLRARA